MNVLFSNLFSGPAGEALFNVLKALSGLMVIAAWILLLGAAVNLFFGFRYSRLAGFVNVFAVCGLAGGISGVLLTKGSAVGFFIGMLLIGGGAVALSWRFPRAGIFLDGFLWGFFLLGFLLIFGGNRTSALILGIVGGLAMGFASCFMDKKFLVVKTAVQGGSVCGILIGLLFWHLLLGLILSVGLSVAGIVVQLLLQRFLPEKDGSGKEMEEEASGVVSEEPLPRVGNPDLFVEDILRELPYVFSEDIMLQMKALPEFFPDGTWICACGQRSGAEQCPRCGLEKEDADTKLNYRYLKEHRTTRLNVEKRMGGSMPVVGRVSEKGEDETMGEALNKETDAETKQENSVSGTNAAGLTENAAAAAAGAVAVAEIAAPAVENPAPVEENPAPAAENPAPVTENAAPAAENPAPDNAEAKKEEAEISEGDSSVNDGGASGAPESAQDGESKGDVIPEKKNTGASVRKSRKKKRAERKNKEAAKKEDEVKEEKEEKAEKTEEKEEKEEKEEAPKTPEEKPAEEEKKEDKDKKTEGDKKSEKNKADKKINKLLLLIIPAVVVLLGIIGLVIYLNRSAIESIRLNFKAASTQDSKEKSELYTDAIEIKENADSWIGLLELALEEKNRKLALLCVDHLEENYPNNLKYRQLKKQYAPAPPTSSLKDGTYNNWEELSLSAGEGDIIYFSVNGGEPYQYKGSVAMNRNGDYTIKAYAENDLGLKSDEASFHYLFEAVMPQAVTFDHESGEYFVNQTVALSQPDGLEIHYTVDGSEPDASSPVYTEPLVCGRGLSIIKAKVFGADGVPSETSTCEIGIHGEIRGNAIRFSESGYICDYFASDKGLCRYDTAGNLIDVIDPKEARGLRFQDGMLYYFSDGFLKRYEEKTGKIDALAKAGADMCAVADGRIYFAEVGGPLISAALDGSDMQDHGGEMTNLDYHDGVLYLAEPNRVSKLLADGSFETIFTRSASEDEDAEEGEEGEGEEENEEKEEEGEDVTLTPIRSILADSEGIYFTSDGLSIYQNGQIGTLVEGISEIDRKEPKKGKAGSGSEHLRYPEKLCTFAGHLCFRYCDEVSKYSIDPETLEKTDEETERKGSVYTYDLESGEFRSIAGSDFFPVSDGYFTYSPEAEGFIKLDFESAQIEVEGEEEASE
ncbi:MAG: chitobiase/beta-hexosaminidase C-terminal domain-containing protein [Lachnospiraceae bacterium]|nr:chitobiase/beta-hexosaminidase C-terminal domain-containing protein [Lachnospiraceae bacterium]